MTAPMVSIANEERCSQRRAAGEAAEPPRSSERVTEPKSRFLSMSERSYGNGILHQAIRVAGCRSFRNCSCSFASFRARFMPTFSVLARPPRPFLGYYSTRRSVNDSSTRRTHGGKRKLCPSRQHQPLAKLTVCTVLSEWAAELTNEVG